MNRIAFQTHPLQSSEIAENIDAKMINEASVHSGEKHPFAGSSESDPAGPAQGLGVSVPGLRGQLAAAVGSGSLHVEVLGLRDLGVALRQRWQELRLLDDFFQSPFWSLEFLEHAQTVHRQVEVSVISVGETVVGFFPFERKKNGAIAVPVAAKMNDAHGVLGHAFDAQQLLSILKHSRLKAYEFHAWFGSESGIGRFAFAPVKSFMARLDASAENPGYRDFLTQDRYTIKQQIRKTRKMVRDHGPIRLEYDCRDPAMLELLIQWKRSQYRRTNILDIFSIEWTANLLRRFHGDSANAGPRCVLSVLYTGDKPCALHVGIEEYGRLHYWFPVYDPDYHQYSAGTELFLCIADHCQNRAIQIIDMGYGEQAYKHKLVNHVTDCCCGVLTDDRWYFQSRRLAYNSHQAFKNFSYKEPIKALIRRIYPDFGRNQFL